MATHSPGSAIGWFLRAGLLLFLILATVRLLTSLETEELRIRLLDSNRLWWSLAGFLLIVRIALWDFRWRQSLVCASLPAHRSKTLPALLGGIFLNSVTPTGRLAGGVFRTRHGVAQGGGAYSLVLGSVLYDQVLHQIVGLVTTTMALLAMGALAGRWILVCTAGGLIVLFFVGLWVVPNSGRRTGRGNLVRWLVDRLEERGGKAISLLNDSRSALKVLRSLLGDTRLRWIHLSSSLLMIGLYAMALGCCFRSLGIESELSACLVAVVLGGALGGLIGTPGGIGGVETGMVMVLVTLGVSEVDAVTATFLFRGLHYGLVVGLGFPCFLWSEAIHSK